MNPDFQIQVKKKKQPNFHLRYREMKALSNTSISYLICLNNPQGQRISKAKKKKKEIKTLIFHMDKKKKKNHLTNHTEALTKQVIVQKYHNANKEYEPV